MPVHPADQCDAFAALHRQGLAIADIAARFGLSVRFVEQRLKLASLSPRLLAEYRAGAMALDQLTAFTLADDHVLQEEVWFESGYGDMTPQLIRRLLTKTQVEGCDRRARFVGVKAYEAAGGVIVRDLFDADDEGYFSDSQLLDRLVAEKLEAVAQNVRAEGWQWVKVSLDGDELTNGHFQRTAPEELSLPEEDEERLTSLCDRYDTLIEALEEDGENGSAELDEISREIDILQSRKISWPDDAKAQAGALVTIGPDGDTKIVRGLVKRAANGENRAKEDATRKARANGYSNAILLDLAAHRTAALRELLVQHPDMALLSLLHALVVALFYEGECSFLEITAHTVDLNRVSKSVVDGKAGQHFQARHVSWLERLPAREACWAWLEGLAPEERSALLAHCVGLTLSALDVSREHEDDDALAVALRLDMCAWWRPTRANFLDRLTKNEILAAVQEGVSQRAAWRLAGMKKDRMSKEAEKLLGGTTWLPAPLRPTAIPAPQTSTD
jgi:ParB family chromosome partitioning protein